MTTKVKVLEKSERELTQNALVRGYNSIYGALYRIFFGLNELCYRFLKRSFDLFCGLFGIIALLPVALVIKIATVATGDFNSIFYTQKRIGKDGKEFGLFKFRSMCPNADAELERILKEDEKLREEYRINKKLEDDPRVTKIGKIIRKASIDELPQLINVLFGQMSLIGNRPYLPKEKEDMGSSYDKIVSTKPGITGYWQVSGRSDTTFEKRLELEEYYSDNYSLELDTLIFFKTFSVVLNKKGAK